MALADSAGVPWEGRHFESNTRSSDDGSAPQPLIDALARFHAGEATESAVVDALRESRLLIPLVAHLGEAGISDSGHTIDKSQELSIVTVAGPDGRNVLPVFSSVDAMQRWNEKARPVPADGIRVALAAASENTDIVVLDPLSDTEFVVRRPALWAIAQGKPWLPSYRDPQVVEAFTSSIVTEPSVVEVRLAAGDPAARFAGAEVLVSLTLIDGLSQGSLADVLERLQAEWAASTVIAERVDSLTVKLFASR
ncbi:SseB family protein [Salinibacterium sp. ZJ454]|uniref:SseB family protein n=1 Tax=Salinibacterium sp. ZJ454 TaxID=2708339 RepID=UPI0014206028|nr:SseB family protein [Salinibacterium sp. ZJ454]